MTPILPTVVVAALAASLPAQVRPQLIGLTDAAPAAVVTQDSVSCGITGCPTLLAPPTNPLDGGTATDATTGTVWVSDGTVVEAIDPASCRVVCPPHRLPNLALTVRVTGLAIDESRNTLVVADSTETISRYRLECPVQSLISSCRPMLPVGHRIGGIATDDVAGLVFYSASGLSGTAPRTLIVIASIDSPCTPLCTIQRISDCNGETPGPLTGLAFDGCRSLLWATDGTHAVAMRIDRSTCTATEVACCTLPNGMRYVGLAARPEPAVASGRACTNPGCPSCPGLQHTATGDPVLGNAAFSLDLRNAPGNARAALFFNVGPCTPPGFVVRPFCAPLLVPINPLPVVINVGTGGGAGCSGQVSIALPIPADRALCGATLSSQFVGLCALGSVGTFVSNCLTYTLQGT